MSAAVTSLRALEAVATHQPLGVSELARLLQLPKPTAQRALQALAEAQWIHRSETQPGRWALTAKALDVANQVGKELGVRETALPSMTELVELSTESAHLAIPDGTDIVIIENVEATQVVRIHWPVGKRSPMYASANGKAILAALPQERRDEHLPPTLPALTPTTITDHAQLTRELDAIRERGYAVQYGEVRSDIASIAAAISPRPQHPAASLSLFIPIQRFPADGGQHLGRLVSDTASKIAAQLAPNFQIRPRPDY